MKMNSLIKLFIFSCLHVLIATTRQSLPYRCKPMDRENKICTLEYRPVCGWFNKNINCLVYPCAINAGNICSACSNKDVEYVTAGLCPTTPTVARPCPQLALCVQGYRWDSNLCRCMPYYVGGSKDQANLVNIVNVGQAQDNYENAEDLKDNIQIGIKNLIEQIQTPDQVQVYDDNFQNQKTQSQAQEQLGNETGKSQDQNTQIQVGNDLGKDTNQVVVQSGNNNFIC